MKRDKRVDDYIAKAEPFARPILEHLRELMARAVPDGVEAIKWGVPHWVVGGRNLAGMASFKAHARLFLHGAMTPDEETSWSRFGKLRRIEDCPEFDELVVILTPRVATLEAGKAIARSNPKAEIPMPEDFAFALVGAVGAQNYWDGFSDAQRRDYLDWITSAKRDETRAKRIATAAEWIGEGKRRNWKYEDC